jgi:hypothetical protein
MAPCRAAHLAHQPTNLAIHRSQSQSKSKSKSDAVQHHHAVHFLHPPHHHTLIAISTLLRPVIPLIRLCPVHRRRFLSRSRCLWSLLPGPTSSTTAPKRRKLDRFAENYSTPYCASDPPSSQVALASSPRQSPPAASPDRPDAATDPPREPSPTGDAYARSRPCLDMGVENHPSHGQRASKLKSPSASRSSSPAKRPASDMDGADPMDMDSSDAQKTSRADDSSSTPMSFQGSSTVAVDDSSAPTEADEEKISLDEQVRMVYAETNTATSADGQAGYVVSRMWLGRVIARSKFSQEMGPFDKSCLEGDIGPVDNADIIGKTARSLAVSLTIQTERGFACKTKRACRLCL